MPNKYIGHYYRFIHRSSMLFFILMILTVSAHHGRTNGCACRGWMPRCVIVSLRLVTV